MSDLNREIRSRGHYEIAIRPEVFLADRVPYEALLDIVQQCAVRLRGWPFPYVGQNKDIQRLEDSIRETEDWERHLEIWRFYQSGQFVYIGSFREDWPERETLESYKPPSGRALLGCYSVSSRCAETYEFAARLANTAAGGDLMRISITLRGIEGRQLYMEDPARMLAWSNTASIPEFTVDETIRSEDLLAQPRILARQAVRKIFLRFGFDVNEAVLGALQAILTDGTSSS
jgi:hypothetical protein